MIKRAEDFFEVMLEIFPYLNNDYKNHIEEYGELLETVVIEDLFMHEIIKLLRDNDNVVLLERIFQYFEEVSCYGDEHLINIFSITTLEILGNEKEILEIAKQYMGPKTTQLQIEADRDLGRIV